MGLVMDSAIFLLLGEVQIQLDAIDDVVVRLDELAIKVRFGDHRLEFAFPLPTGRGRVHGNEVRVEFPLTGGALPAFELLSACLNPNQGQHDDAPVLVAMGGTVGMSSPEGIFLHQSYSSSWP